MVEAHVQAIREDSVALRVFVAVFSVEHVYVAPVCAAVFFAGPAVLLGGDVHDNGKDIDCQRPQHEI